MLKGKVGFTLLELIVVIIIIGILATVGFVQYTSIIEKGRKTEARANLGTLRQLEVAYFQDPSSGGSYADLSSLATGLPAACTADYYFQYSCASATGSCTADRCNAGGKSPNCVAPACTDYTITLDVNGTFTGTGPWQ